MVKKQQTFFENQKNHAKDMASNPALEDHYAICKTRHLAFTTIITCSPRFSSAKFCCYGAL